MKNQQTVTQILNDLLKLHMESEMKYKECVNQLFHRGVRSFFVTQAQLKNKFVHQLALEIQKQGGDLHTTAMDTSHFDFYDSLRTIDYDALLMQCINYEYELLESYNSILKSNQMPETTENLLLKQRVELASYLEKEKIDSYKRHEKLVS